jgi:hypothetical protein
MKRVHDTLQRMAVLHIALSVELGQRTGLTMAFRGSLQHQAYLASGPSAANEEFFMDITVQ